MEQITVAEFEAGISQELREKMEADILSEGGEREHAPHSPSSLKYKAMCGGFRQDNTNDMTAANRGTIGHKACELSNPFIVNDGDEFLLMAVENCIGYVNSIRAQYCQPAAQPKPFYFRERPVQPAAAPGEFEVLPAETAVVKLALPVQVEARPEQEKKAKARVVKKKSISPRDAQTVFGMDHMSPKPPLLTTTSSENVEIF